ncbi:MAG: hypothetical protein AB7N54_05120 [Alphaproteobacteria bacterium]
MKLHPKAGQVPVDDTQLKYPRAEIESRWLMRERAARGSGMAFIDQDIPGHEREIIDVVGMGVTENLADEGARPKLGTARGFAITYVRAANGKGIGMHTHPREEEVFIPVRGNWEILWLEDSARPEDEAMIFTLAPGDAISVPPGVQRASRCASDDPDALLMVIIGGPDIGRVRWHDSVLENARRTGLELDADGFLVDRRAPKKMAAG